LTKLEKAQGEIIASLHKVLERLDQQQSQRTSADGASSSNAPLSALASEPLLKAVADGLVAREAAAKLEYNAKVEEEALQAARGLKPSPLELGPQSSPSQVAQGCSRHWRKSRN